MTFNPMIVALYLTYHKHGLKASRELFQRAFDVNRITAKKWYVPMFFLMPFLMLLMYVIMVRTREPLEDPQFPIEMIPIFFTLFFVTAIGEELGWQVYAYEPLKEQNSPLQAALIVGTVWALWHVVPYTQGENHNLSWIMWQCLFTVALRVLLSWIYENTNQSAFSAITMHATSNVSTFLFPNYGSYYDPIIASLLLVPTVAIIIVSQRGELRIKPLANT